MGIILDLQREALDVNADILSLLRKALLVSRKLKLNEFGQWIDSELNGYKSENMVPSYRNAHGELRGFNPYHGWISVIINDKHNEEMLTVRKIMDSIPRLQNFLGDKSKYICFDFPGEGNRIISGLTGFETKYSLFVCSIIVNDIIERVKNEILNWAITLEEKGIVGDGISFTMDEQIKACNDKEMVQYISNFFGDVSHSQIQQGTNKSLQKDVVK